MHLDFPADGGLGWAADGGLGWAADGGLNFLADDGLGWAADGGHDFPVDGGLGWTADGGLDFVVNGGLGCAMNSGGLKWVAISMPWRGGEKRQTKNGKIRKNCTGKNERLSLLVLRSGILSHCVGAGERGDKEFFCNPFKGSYDAFFKDHYFFVFGVTECWHVLLFKKHSFSSTVHYCRSSMPRLSQMLSFLQSPSFQQE